jgi:hypothetical protein
MAIEQKKKISKSKKGRFTGNNNPFYGKQHTAETKEKISASNKGKVFDKDVIATRNEKQKGIPKLSVSAKLKGKPKSEEHKEKMRQAWIKRKENQRTKLHSPPG